MIDTNQIVPSAIFGLAFVVGVRSTWRLWRTYRAIRPLVQPNHRRLGQAFVVVSVLIIIGVGFFGALATRRLLGLDPLGWTAIAAWLISIPILFVPLYLERVWDHIGRRG